MQKDDFIAAFKGHWYALLVVLAVMAPRYAVLLADKGIDGFLYAIILMLVTYVIVAIQAAFLVAPLVSERITNILTFSVSDPYEPATKMEFARCLLLQKRYEDAAEIYEEARELEWVSYQDWLQMAELHRKHLKDPQTAVDLLMEAQDAQNWTITEHIDLLNELVETHYYDLDSPSAATSIYNFIQETYGSTPYGKTFLERHFDMLKPKADSPVLS